MATAHSSPTDAKPTPSADELVMRAERLRPLVIAQQAETEERTFYSEEIHEAFQEAGFYRLLVPKKYGGYEVDLPTFWRVIIEVSRGCESTGWCLLFAVSHAVLAAGLFESEAQDAFFEHTDFRCPAAVKSTIVPTRVDGGWMMTGTVPYSSGVPYADWAMGQAVTESGQWLLFCAPRATWTRLDDWGDSLGLRGSGSHSVHFDGAFIPEQYVLEDVSLMDIDVSNGTPGLRIHGNPMYAGRTFTFLAGGNVAVMVGGVKGAVDEFEGLMQRNVQWPPLGPRSADPDYQRWFGLAIGKTAAAEAMLLGSAAEWMGIVARGPAGGTAFTREEDLLLNIVGREAMNLAWETLQGTIFRTGGSSEARAGKRMERIFRDSAMGWGHFTSIMGDFAARELAKERLGITTPAGEGGSIDPGARAGV